MGELGRAVAGLICVVGLAAPAFEQIPSPQPAQTAPAASPLAPILWLAGGWAAEAKQPGSSASSKIFSRLTPQLDGRSMTIETSFDGKPVYQGMFAYDPAQKAIAFWYVTPDGESVRGTVDPKETADPLFDFLMTLTNGVHFTSILWFIAWIRTITPGHF